MDSQVSPATPPRVAKRTRLEKQNAIIDTINFCPSWSNRRIADHCGVSPPMVASVRRKIGEPGPINREGIDGKMHSVNPKMTPIGIALEKLASIRELLAEYNLPEVGANLWHVERVLKSLLPFDSDGRIQ